MDSGGRQNLPEIKIPAKNDTKIEYMRDDWDENDVARMMQPYLDGLEFRSFRSTGIHHFKLMVFSKCQIFTNRIHNLGLMQIPKKAAKLEIQATYTAPDGKIESAELKAERHFSPSARYISVSTSTEMARPGEYAIFHVVANFVVENFNYLVIELN